MKTILTLFITGILFYMPTITKAQDELSSGFTSHKVVNPPLAYRDILRTQSLDWTKEVFLAGQNTWRNVELCVNSKNVFGGFDELSTAYWDTVNNAWENNYKTTYNSIYDNNNDLVEQEVNTVYGGNSFVSKNEYTYYPNRKVKSQNSYTKFAGSFQLTSKTNFLYDANENRYKDSSTTFNPSNNIITFYTYDNNGNCVHEIQRYIPKNFWDTINEYKYEYYNTGKLKRMAYYYGSGTLPWLDRNVKEYTYTQNGEIDKIYQWLRQPQEGDSLKLRSIYSHYYTNSRLSSMSLHSGTGQFVDSIVLNYLPNGQYDTAQVYRAGASPTTWESTNSQRIIFTPNSTTGINKPAATIGTLKAYPNPTSNTLFVELSTATNGNTNLVLIDLSGRVLKTKPVSFFAGQTTTTELQIDELATGIYMLRVGNNTIKVFKQ